MHGSNNLLSFLSGVILCGLMSVVIGCGSGEGGQGGESTFGTFVAVGDLGSILTSPDGINWNVVQSEVGGGLSDVTHGNNTFVAVGGEPRTLAAIIISSPNGVNWTVRSSGIFPCLNGVTFGNGIFVAVSSLFGTILTSPDGVNWTESATLTMPGLGSAPLQAITYGNGVFVTVSAFGGIYHSPDCVNWTTVSEPFPSLYAVTYGNGIFVTAGGNEIFTSSDGATWTSKTLDLFGSFEILSLAHGNNMFVAVGEKIQGQGTQPTITLMILTSADGVNWTGGPSTIDPSVNRLSFANGIFFLTGINGTILTSPDGINWTSRMSGTIIETITAVTFG